MSEKLQILKMIEEGKISAEEGIKLLDALSEEKITEPKSKLRGRLLRIKVFDPSENQNVDIRVPMSLVKALLKMGNAGMSVGAKFNPDLESLKGIDLLELEDALLEVEDGNFVDITTEDGTVVKISIDV